MIEKTDIGLVAWCKQKESMIPDAGYVYGTYFSAIITEAIIQYKAKQYPSIYTASYIKRSRKWIGHEAGDCVGLIKGYYWYDPISGKVIYRLDGRPDVSANGMYRAGRTANGKTADQNYNVTWGMIANLPERQGVLVWRDGHIGVYVGNGYAIESRGVDFGVVKTKVTERPWTNWVLCPWITYTNGGDDMELKLGAKGQAVYSYQIICKRLGKDIGAYGDMVLKDSAGNPLKTGCDGSFGPVMEKVTNELLAQYGLPANGIVTDALYGNLNKAIQELQTGVPQEKYDAVVAENEQLEKENNRLTVECGKLGLENQKLREDLTNANNQIVAVTSDRDAKIRELTEAANAMTVLYNLEKNY